MSLFNSLGSNYSFSFVWRALCATNDSAHQDKLTRYLDERYRGQTRLVYKGREALELALTLAGLPDSSTVAINGYTCYVVYKAILNAQNSVEYVDVAERDLHFSAAQLEQKIQANPAIKAVVIQNTLGYVCDIEKIEVICKRANLLLIEDLAHSVGATYTDGREAGTVGDFTVLTFSQDKMIDGISGGALIVRNKLYQTREVAAFAPVNQGRQRRDHLYPLFTFLIRKTHAILLGKALHVVLKATGLLSLPMSSPGQGTIHQLPNWYCSLVYHQFQMLKQNLAHRRAIAQIYLDGLKVECVLPSTRQNKEGSTHLRFPILVKQREKLIEYLKQDRVYVSDIWYDAPVAPKKYLHLTDYAHQCPRSEQISNELLNLPTHQAISPKQAQALVKRINLWLSSQ